MLGTKYVAFFAWCIRSERNYADTASNLSSSRPPFIGYPHDTKKPLLVEKEIVSQYFKLLVWFTC